MRAAEWATGLLLVAAGARVGRSQGLEGLRAAQAITQQVAPFAAPSGSAPTVFGLPVRAPLAPVVSLVLPGGGQFLQGKDRFIVYAALEGLLWFKYSKDVRDRNKQVNEYKDLARRVARSHFSPNGPDGDWTYYESMRDYEESGDYSKTDAGPIIPETDRTTFNGYTWQVALATNPDSVAALVQYEARAIKPDLQWSWSNAGLQFDLYKRTTAKRNDAVNAAVTDLTVIALNHLFSMIDAFATFRLEAHPAPNGRTAVGASLRW